MNYNKINNLVGWICFAIAALTYILTLEPTTSVWDSGEFISAAYKMQIVHQPGAPLFLMIENILSNLAMGDHSRIAYWMNMGSALSSALTILFLFWTITALARKALGNNKELDKAQLITIMGAGMVGALAYTFSDTFWFSAVETEVYGMSSLCTAVVFWAILKWEAHADDPHADKWLIFIAYMMGLSIGVHLLNLLTIPAMAIVVYFKKTAKPTSGGVIKALLLGCVILGLILWGIVQYLIKIAAYFDLFFVNSLGMGFGSGVIVFAILVIGGLVYGIWYSIKRHKPRLNTALLCVSFIIFGYSSFSMILIRAKADPTLNNNDPDNAFSFLGYLNREQYGDDPLLKGPYFNSERTGIDYGATNYRIGKEKYVSVGQSFSYTYDRETILPRIYSDRPDHVQYYRNWLQLGENEDPSFSDNLKFLFSYQLGHMYARYFMWNFAGRQNNEQGFGNFTDGNWISGITPLDQMRLGGQQALPDTEKNNPARNTYYFLPLILGLIGAYWHFKHNQKDAGVVGLLFFFTGIAIVLYLNQKPIEPRERDYAYAGSFYAFTIWIGFAVLAISEWINKKANAKAAGIAATVIGLLAAPVLMAKEGWDDHDRSMKYVSRDIFAVNYLESCAPNAILFTYGDNDTYPLWYAQEVENIRPDVRVVNLSLLGADWYVRQMKEKVNDSEALPISMEDEQFVQGTRDVIGYYDYQIKGAVELKNILQILLSDNDNDKLPTNSGGRENFLPTKNLIMSINKADVIKNQVVPKAWEDRIADTISWTYNKDIVSRADLTMFDILVHNNWERPIQFAITVPTENYLGLDNYLYTEGFTYRLMPIKRAPDEDPQLRLNRINTEAMYDNVMNKFAWGNIKNVSFLDPASYGIINVVINNFVSLSNALVEEGQMEKARTVMKRAMEVLPTRIYSERQALLRYYLAEALFKVNDVEHANLMINENITYIQQHLNYYFSIAQTKPNLEMERIQYGMHTLDGMQKLAETYKQPEIKEKIEETVQQLEEMYTTTVQ